MEYVRRGANVMSSHRISATDPLVTCISGINPRTVADELKTRGITDQAGLLAALPFASLTPAERTFMRLLIKAMIQIST